MSIQPISDPPGTCDWGDCDYLAKKWRESPATHEWLPVCFPHSAQGEQFYATLHTAYQNTKGSFA